mgnify:CR=1 FL=1
MVNVPTSDDIVNVAMKYKPWAGSWWNALIQGLLALALGIFLFMNPLEATRVLAQLAVACFIDVVNAFVVFVVAEVAGREDPCVVKQICPGATVGGA